MSEKNPIEREDPIWSMRMQMLMKRKRSMEIAQIIDNALEEHYSELGLPVPIGNVKIQNGGQFSSV